MVRLPRPCLRPINKGATCRLRNTNKGEGNNGRFIIYPLLSLLLHYAHYFFVDA
jgi:hypothetical protein